MAIFDTMYSFQQYCNANDINHYKQLIKEFDIQLIYTDTLPKKYLGLAIPGTRTVFIKNNITTIGLDFIKAHEVNHVLLGTIPAAFYNSSFVSNMKVESDANSGAFFILLKHYIKEFDLCLDNFRLGHFMQYYEIPRKYYFQLKYFIEQYESEVFYGY